MTPFLINRYWGSEKKESESNDSSEALQKLLAKVEERRQKQKPTSSSRKNETVISELKSATTCVNEPPSKKRKLISGQITPVEKPPNPADSNTNIRNDDFTIISTIDFKKKPKLKRVLPNWLKNPAVISVDLQHLTETIYDLPLLDSSLIESLKRNKITYFFPVQSKLIPWLLKYHKNSRKFWPRDVCVSAPTGSGKTLAFVLPIIQILKKRVKCCVRALIVLPTKDLAFQVYQVFEQYIGNTSLSVINLGNSSLEREKKKLITHDEFLGYRSLVDIVVTTPGRLVEHLKYTKGFSLSNLRFLVIDEADHVMDSVQNDWLGHLQTYIPPSEQNSSVPYLTLSKIEKKPMRPQRLLFSATLSQDPEKLSNLSLFQPYLFTSMLKYEDDEQCIGNSADRTEFIGKFATPAELTEYYTICPLSTKPLVLYHIIKQNQWKRILCFTDSVASVHKLAYLLQQLSSLDSGDTMSMNVVEISSKLPAKVHREILKKFSAGDVDILVTTDTLARGIDLQNIGYVVLYDAPKFAKNYIHRIGRTGRAGQKGTSLVLVTPEQKEDFDGILNICGKKNLLNKPVSIDELRKYEDVYRSSLDALRTKVENEQEISVKTRKTKHPGSKKKKRV